MDSKKAFLLKHFSARKRNWKKKNQGHYFYIESMESYSPGRGEPWSVFNWP